MIKANHLRKVVIKPALEAINLYSADAEELLIATCAQESLGGKYLIQETKSGIFYKGGLGIFQMEAPTYDDTIRYLQNNKPELLTLIRTACRFQDSAVDAVEMTTNLKYAAMIARVKYLRDKHPIPPAGDINQIWEYYKRIWNTEQGRAQKEGFLRNYALFNKGSL